MGPFTIPGCFLFKHSLQKRFFYPPLSTAVIFNIKIQNCTCVPFRKSQIRERGTLIGESEKFSSSKGEKSYGRQRGWAKFSEQCGTPRLVVSSDFRTIFLWGAEAASFLINRFPLGGSWASGTSSFRTKLRTQKRERERTGEEQNDFEPTEDGSFGTAREIKKNRAQISFHVCWQLFNHFYALNMA